MLIMHNLLRLGRYAYTGVRRAISLLGMRARNDHWYLLCIPEADCQLPSDETTVHGGWGLIPGSIKKYR